MEPLISVITVCFNSAGTLESTIKNVLGQTINNIEYIIIDGGSTDGTVSIIEKYSDKLKYWISEPDNGIYDAMNKGWKVAGKDSYILYLGAGDLIITMPGKESLKADIIAGDVEVGSKFLYKPKIDSRLKLGNTLHHQALLVKKTVHPGAPFNTQFKTYADFDFNQRLLKSGAKIIIDPGFKGYAMEGGVSTTFNKEESLAVVKKNYGWFYVKLAQLYYLLRHEV